jgi:hypothetical protein
MLYAAHYAMQPPITTAMAYQARDVYMLVPFGICTACITCRTLHVTAG